MTETIPNLWPEQFHVDVQSPYAILSVQANLLGKVTRGILQGVVETESSKERVQHRLVVVAPAYNSYRHTLIVAIHQLNLPYPVEVRAEGLEAKEGESQSSEAQPDYPSANDDLEMQHLVSQALRSGRTKATIASLISKSNDAKTPFLSHTNGTANQLIEKL